MIQLFFDTALILAIATAFALFANFIRQPILVGYIAAGIVAGLLGLFEGSREALDLLASFGITFLLFLVGLELRFSEIKTYGLIVAITGLGQIVFTSIVGFILLSLLGFSFKEAFYVAVAITFSSTVIIVKLLSEKRDLDSLYGKITIGFLLVQDAVAIFALVLVAAVGSSGVSLGDFALVLLKGIFLLTLIFLLNKTLVSWVFEKASRSLEILFVSSVAWALLLSSVASFLGLSIEIGAFLAGVSLASLPVEHQIASRVRPLRDLFVVFFFVLLGLSITFGNVLSAALPIILISLFILIGNPLIVLIIMGILGFRKRTSFLASITVAQISEFSLILVFLGKKVGDLDQSVVDIVTAVGLITILVSSYLILHSNQLYKKLAKHLEIFERKEKIEQISVGEKDFSNHIVLIGAGRLGWEILKQLRRQGEQVLVVEFNPNIVSVLKQKNIDYLFGDISDPDIFNKAAVAKAKMVISTVFDSTDTNELLSEIGTLKDKPLIFVTSADREHALKFYEMGADYVIIPRVLSGYQVAHLITKERLNKFKLENQRNKHLADLKEELTQFITS